MIRIWGWLEDYWWALLIYTILFTGIAFIESIELKPKIKTTTTIADCSRAEVSHTKEIADLKRQIKDLK